MTMKGCLEDRVRHATIRHSVGRTAGIKKTERACFPGANKTITKQVLKHHPLNRRSVRKQSIR